MVSKKQTKRLPVQKNSPIEGRNELAIQRTKLAKERTHLAYIRTGFSAILAGVFFTGFFQKGIYHNVGYLIAAIGIVFLIYGFFSHRETHKIIETLEKKIRKKPRLIAGFKFP